MIAVIPRREERKLIGSEMSKVPTDRTGCILAKDEMRRSLAYTVSPLVSTGVPTAKRREKRGGSMKKALRSVEGSVPTVTPSPDVGEHRTNGTEMTSFNQRRLFASPARGRAELSCAEKTTLVHVPPAKKELFRGADPLSSPRKLKTDKPFSSRLVRENDMRRRQVMGRGPNQRLQIVDTFDSLASVASRSVAEPNNRSYPPRLKQVRGSSTGESFNFEPSDNFASPTNPTRSSTATMLNSAYKGIPPQLVSVLAPMGLNAVDRLPKSQEEVLKKSAAMRKKYVSPRMRLARRCKMDSTGMSYHEDSDDDFYFDSVVHAGLKTEKNRGPIPLPSAEVREAGDETASPITDNTPTEVSLTKPTWAWLEHQSKRHSPNAAGDAKVNASSDAKTSTNSQTLKHPPRKARIVEGNCHQKCASGRKAEVRKEKRASVLRDFEACSPKRPVSQRTHSLQARPTARPTMKPRVVSPSRLAPQQQRHADVPRSTVSNFQEDLGAQAAVPLGMKYQHVDTEAKTTQALLATNPARPSTTARGSIEQNKLPHGLNNQQGTSTGAGGAVSETQGEAQPLPGFDELHGKEIELKQAHCNTVRDNFEAKTRSSLKGGSKSRASKVRFAPTTTTFSLQIRVKTSASSSKKGRKTSNPSLNESAVQSIANQIAKAYFAQNSGNLGVDRSDVLSDVDEESDSDSSHSSDENSYIVEAQQDMVHETTKCSEAERGQAQSDVGGTDHREVLVDQDYDTRSVASEITMDIDLLKSEHEMKMEASRFPADDQGPTALVQDDEHDDEGMNQSYRNDHLRSAQGQSLETASVHTRSSMKLPGGSRASELHKQHIYSAMGKDLHSKIPAVPEGDIITTETHPSAPDERKAEVSLAKRKRRRLSSSDSLAGDSLASIYSFRACRRESLRAAAPDVLVERELSSSIEKDNHEEVDDFVGPINFAPSRQEAIENPVVRHSLQESNGNEETVVTDKSHEDWRPQTKAFVTEGCGECSGCLQTFDCLACSKCMASIQRGLRFGHRTGCLRRFCKAISHQRSFDTLGRTCDRATTDVTPAYPTDSDCREQAEDARSIFSEATSVYSSASKQRRSRAAKLWSRRWAKERRKRSKGVLGFNGGEHGMKVDGRKRGHRSKKGKKSKSLLHDLELPMPTDGSVASMLEGRKSLRALMAYDEADQDWL